MSTDSLKIYVFKNIRFGAPPVGNLRWAKPAPPAVETEIQDGSYGPICVQAPIKGPQLTGPGADSPVGEAINQFLGGIPVPSFVGASEGMHLHPFTLTLLVLLIKLTVSLFSVLSLVSYFLVLQMGTISDI